MIDYWNIGTFTSINSLLKIAGVNIYPRVIMAPKHAYLYLHATLTINTGRGTPCEENK